MTDAIIETPLHGLDLLEPTLWEIEKKLPRCADTMHALLAAAGYELERQDEMLLRMKCG